MDESARGLRFDSRDQGSCANDIHDAREIVGEHTERHFGDDLRQRFRQKVGRAHARFHRAERVLERLAANARLATSAMLRRLTNST